MNTPPRFFAAPPPSSLADKATLRTHMRGLRRELARAAPDAAVHAAQAFARAGLEAGEAAAVYHALGGELDAWPLAVVLRRAGARVVLPVAERPDAPLRFREAQEGAAFAVDAAGVPAPGPEAAELRPTLVFAPCLAFDAAGGRLGQGGGYYDRTLAALRADGPPVLTIGLAYAGQEVERVPADAHDARLDAVLTQAGLRRFGRDG